jgi:hypothetical protein
MRGDNTVHHLITQHLASFLPASIAANAPCTSPYSGKISHLIMSCAWPKGTVDKPQC